jgi:hypothetical protein
MVVHFKLQEFSKKFEMGQMGYSGNWGKLIHEKNLKSLDEKRCRPFRPVTGRQVTFVAILQYKFYQVSTTRKNQNKIKK